MMWLETETRSTGILKLAVAYHNPLRGFLQFLRGKAQILLSDRKVLSRSKYVYNLWS